MYFEKYFRSESIYSSKVFFNNKEFCSGIKVNIGREKGDASVLLSVCGWLNCFGNLRLVLSIVMQQNYHMRLSFKMHI